MPDFGWYVSATEVLNPLRFCSTDATRVLVAAASVMSRKLTSSHMMVPLA